MGQGPTPGPPSQAPNDRPEIRIVDAGERRERPVPSDRCSACGAPLAPDDEYCGRCGTAVARKCASCRAPLRPGDEFCGRCGAAVAPRP